MISIGTDITDVNRFKNWHKYKEATLSKIFSKPEIAYCKSNLTKSAERFAARFAAREAIYKMLNPYLIKPLGFLELNKFLSIDVNPYPKVTLSRDLLLLLNLKDINISLSWTHSKNIAFATAILYTIKFDKQK